MCQLRESSKGMHTAARPVKPVVCMRKFTSAPILILLAWFSPIRLGFRTF